MKSAINALRKTSPAPFIANPALVNKKKNMAVEIIISQLVESDDWTR